MTCIDVTLPPPGKQQRALKLVVAAALVDSDGRILIADRPVGKAMAGYWEFPGGKVADGETPEQALVRELKEELGITTSIGCLSPLAFASYTYDDFHLLMPLFVCRVWHGTPQPREGQQLAWVKPYELRAYQLLPADVPLVPVIEERI
jgi:8-oxo-dGTP diphosphatase